MLFYFLLYIAYFVLLYFKIRLPITSPLRTFSAVVLYVRQTTGACISLTGYMRAQMYQCFF